MKFIIVAASMLATFAMASPTGTNPGCKPGTYRCNANAHTQQPGWDVCNTSKAWVYAGDCPPNTICKFNTANGSPYCVPPGFQFP